MVGIFILISKTVHFRGQYEGPLSPSDFIWRAVHGFIKHHIMYVHCMSISKIERAVI